LRHRGRYRLVPQVRLREHPRVQLPEYLLRWAGRDDGDFITEMARHASTLFDRELPAADAPEVLELLPAEDDPVLLLVSAGAHRVGAAWWRTAASVLVPDQAGASEVCIALAAGLRGQGLGMRLLQGLLAEADERHVAALVLNVHLRNAPALHLYMNCGFAVAGAGRGVFGVAMVRHPPVAG